LKENGRESYVESAFFHFIPQFVSEDDLFNKVYQTYRGWITQANHKTWKKKVKVDEEEEEKRRHVSAPGRFIKILQADRQDTDDVLSVR